MQSLCRKFANSPEWARVAPLAVYAILGVFQGQLGPASRYWFYIAKTIVGAWMLWEVRPFVPEMRWKVCGEGVAAEIACWVGQDGLFPRLAARDLVKPSSFSR